MSGEKGSKYLQYFAAIAGNLAIMSTTTYLGWMNPILLKLQQNNPISPDNPIGYAINSDEASWLIALPLLSAPIGSFLFAHLAKRWGRRRILLFTVLLFGISTLAIATAKSVITLCISRIVTGIAGGSSLAILPMYTAEISEASIRGILSSFMQVFMNIGWLYSFCIGPFTSYTTNWILSSILPIIFFVVFYFMPESPVYLINVGKQEEAVKVLEKLRGKNLDSVKREADEILENIRANAKIDTNILDLIRVKSNFKALLLSCTLFTFQNFSGTVIVLNYAQVIFDAAGGENEFISPALSTIIVGVVLLVFGCVTSFFVDSWGRRILLIISGIGETISLFTLGLYFFMAKSGDAGSISWLPVTSLMIFIAMYSLGWGGIPWVCLAEMFNSDIKSKAFGVAILWLNGIAFLILKFFPSTVDAIGMDYTFWLFAVICLMSVFFIVFVLPETKGKSLREIQIKLAGHVE